MRRRAPLIFSVSMALIVLPSIGALGDFFVPVWDGKG